MIAHLIYVGNTGDQTKGIEDFFVKPAKMFSLEELQEQQAAGLGNLIVRYGSNEQATK